MSAVQQVVCGNGTRFDGRRFVAEAAEERDRTGALLERFQTVEHFEHVPERTRDRPALRLSLFRSLPLRLCLSASALLTV